MGDIVLSNGHKLSSDKLSGLTQKKSLNDILKGVKQPERMGKLLIVIMDTSGSMHDPMSSKSTKIDVAWKVFQNVLAPNMAGLNYAVITFDSFDTCNWSIRPTSDTKALVRMNTPQAEGGTPIQGSLREAWNYIRLHCDQARIILLTDGMPTDSSSDEILESAKAFNKIPIDTVGIGNGSGCYDPSFLKRLSEMTGGLFSEASDASMLSQVIRELSPAVRLALGPAK